MDFPTYQPEIDSVILLNLDNETLIEWLLDNQYVRDIFKSELDKFMKRYVKYGKRAKHIHPDKPYMIDADGIPHFGLPKIVQEDRYFVDKDNQEKLVDFALPLIEQRPEIVRMLINYLNKKNVFQEFYDRIYYEYLLNLLDNNMITKENLVMIFSLYPKDLDSFIVQTFIGEQLNGINFNEFIPIFEAMILAAKEVESEEILTQLRKEWEVESDGRIEEAGYYDERRDEDRITLIKYIFDLLDMTSSHFEEEDEEI